MSQSRLRPWMTQAVAEAALVVFAVLVALAVDEWWEGRENEDLARRTTEAVAGELRSNREDLLASLEQEDPDATLAALTEALDDYREGREPEDMSVNWNVTLMSSAAWETAQLTRTTTYMDLDLVMQLAQVYELQRFFSRNQDELASLISDVGARIESEPVLALGRVRSRLALTVSLARTLTTVYACTLARLEGPEAPEADACPEAR